jgi:hypothetical protein
VSGFQSPTLAGFLTFLADFVGIPSAYLPANSPFPQFALDQAQRFVIRAHQRFGGGPDYTLAVYNAATHILITIAPDQPGRANEEGSFTRMRRDAGLNKPDAAGVVTATSDNGTSTTLATPDALRQLTLTDLNFMKTTFGQSALAFNQDYGPIFGVS